MHSVRLAAPLPLSRSAPALAALAARFASDPVGGSACLAIGTGWLEDQLIPCRAPTEAQMKMVLAIAEPAAAEYRAGMLRADE